MSLTEKWNVFFLGKKLISVFCFTLTLPWLLLIAGLFFPEYLWWIAAVIVIGAILAGPFGQGLLWLLSRRYPQLDVSALPAQQEYLIGVAGSGFQQHSRRVPESWFGDNLVIRLTEAGRVAQELNQRHIAYLLCVSMPEHPEMLEEKLVGLKAFFSKYGVPEERIAIVDTALDSENEVAAFQKIREPLIIVSNSWHIPRLMLTAHQQQVKTIAAPAGQIFKAPKLKFNLGILPTGGGIQGLECALHEIMGIVELKIKYMFQQPPSQ